MASENKFSGKELEKKIKELKGKNCVYFDDGSEECKKFCSQMKLKGLMWMGITFTCLKAITGMRVLGVDIRPITFIILTNNGNLFASFDGKGTNVLNDQLKELKRNK